MCAAVVCEVPEGCMYNAAEPPACCGPISNECDPCPNPCNPCQAPPSYTPCPPAGGGDCCCPCPCGEYNSCCYQQPPRTRPIRPMNTLGPCGAPPETDTIYRRSYYGNCGDCFRPKPILPCSSLFTPNCPMERCTTQKLSYMPPCPGARTAPIRPPNNGLKFCGPVYHMTSQKHDFVPKGYSKRTAIHPRDGIFKPCAPLERCTVQKLSYMPVDVCQNPPPKPITQGYSYIRPSGPMENCTIQKLSYLPQCIPPKEHMPWADKVRSVPPPYANLCSTYNLSYMPNCNMGRTAPVMPINGLRFLGTDAGDGNTVYKLSYMPVAGTRPAPILPRGGLCMPSGPMERCTVQKLSYQPNCCPTRTLPIRPKENCLKPSGAMYYMTTQKHDFVPKPQSRRAPIRPASWICRPSGAMDRCTINKLSYMPVNVCEYRRPEPIRPRVGVCRPTGPMDTCTTYKLSYLPNCPAPRMDMPWARQDNYIKPTAPIEKCTIQKLSYGPPGTFSKCGTDCGGGCPPSSFPKAGIC